MCSPFQAIEVLELMYLTGIVPKINGQNLAIHNLCCFHVLRISAALARFSSFLK